jgi:hypothetical protein
MLSVKGTFTNGVAQPFEPVAGFDGRAVIITFLDEEVPGARPPAQDSEWDRLTRLIEDCAVRTDRGDLAHQHDHYLHGHTDQP